MKLSDYEISCIKEFYTAKDEKAARRAKGKFRQYQKLKRKLHLKQQRREDNGQKKSNRANQSDSD